MTSLQQPSALRRRRREAAVFVAEPDVESVSEAPAADDADRPAKARPDLAPGAGRATPPGLFGHVSQADHAMATVLLIVACAVRFFQLSRVSSVIFDEVHYGKFTNWVLSGEYFFDVNPPFGKWVIALVASLLGFDPTLDAFEKPGSAISSQAQTFAGRAPAALFGSLTVPVFYWLCRQLRLSGASAFLGASLILFDSMHVVQSRLIMVDSLLVFLTCAGLLCALLLWDAKQVCLRGEGRRHAREVVTVAALLVATGILCGLSVSVRWTAFATPAVVLIVSVFGVPPFCLCPLNWLEVVVLGASMFAAYYGSFAVFLMTLHKSGTGNAFMSNSFQMCLAGSRAALDAAAAGTDAACRMSMWSRFVELNQKIFAYSKGIRGSDKWGSPWWQWCVNWRGALYYRSSRTVGGTDESPDRLEAIVYALMNPAMVAVIDVLMCLFVGSAMYAIRHRKRVRVQQATVEQLQRGCVLLFGWMGSMLPTMVVYRSGPIYQYLPGLFFAQALGALTFDMLAPRGKTQRYLVALVCLLLVMAFVHWSPWVYARELTPKEHTARRWLPAWD